MLENYKHLTHKLVAKTGDEFHVDTPFVTDFSEIKNTVLEMTDSRIVNHSLYPKGFELLTVQEADSVTVYTNYPLRETSTGQYEVVLPVE